MKTTIKVLLVIFTFAFFSCQKNDVIEPSSSDLSSAQLKSATIAINDVAVESVSDVANYETYFYGGFEQMLRQLAQTKGSMGNLMNGQNNMHYMNGSAPSVSIDTAAAGYPITITVDYGTGKETKHGSMISGKVLIEISGAKKVDGSTRTISFINCVIDSIGINGKRTETFNGDNLTTAKMTTLSDVNFTLTDGTIINRVGNNVMEWLKGLNTPLERDDDMMQITGTINVKSSTGNNYSRVITDPLIRLGDCNYPVQGTVQYKQNGNEIASLNYGAGVCDNLAKLTSNGTTVEIVLKDHAMTEAMTDGQHNNNMGGNGSMGGNNNAGGNGMMNGNGTGNTNGTGTMGGNGGGMMGGKSSNGTTNGNGNMNGNGTGSKNGTGTMGGNGANGSNGTTNGNMNGNGAGTTNGTGTMTGNTSGNGMMGGSGH